MLQSLLDMLSRTPAYGLDSNSPLWYDDVIEMKYVFPHNVHCVNCSSHWPGKVHIHHVNIWGKL